MSIRNAAKALIVEDKRILLNKCSGRDGQLYYTLPGGGQKQYESIEEAVLRECLEETGYTVSIRRLAALAETMPAKPEDRVEGDDYAHKVMFFFLCELDDTLQKIPLHKDLDQIGTEWISLDDLQDLNVKPALVKQHLPLILQSKALYFFGTYYE